MAQTFTCCDLQLLILMLRAVIGDLDETCLEYTDKRLTQLILVASKRVKAEVSNLCQNYTITVDCTTGQFDINPTPDEVFADLIVTKAACMLINADMRAKALFDGTSAKCGPVSISTSSGSTAWQYFKDFGPCKTYETLKEKLEFRQPIIEGHGVCAVLSPFISNNYRCCGCGRYGLGGCGCGGGCGGCSSGSGSCEGKTCTSNNPEKTT